MRPIWSLGAMSATMAIEVAITKEAATACRKRQAMISPMVGCSPIAKVAMASPASPHLNSEFLSVTSANRPIGNSNAAAAPRNTVSSRLSSSPLAPSSRAMVGSGTPTIACMNALANCDSAISAIRSQRLPSAAIEVPRPPRTARP